MKQHLTSFLTFRSKFVRDSDQHFLEKGLLALSSVMAIRSQQNRREKWRERHWKDDQMTIILQTAPVQGDLHRMSPLVTTVSECLIVLRWQATTEMNGEVDQENLVVVGMELEIVDFIENEWTETTLDQTMAVDRAKGNTLIRDRALMTLIGLHLTTDVPVDENTIHVVVDDPAEIMV
jgi:hypothetical protein